MHRRKSIIRQRSTILSAGGPDCGGDDGGEEVCIRQLTILGKGHHSLFEVISPPSATMFRPHPHSSHSAQQPPSPTLCMSLSELTSQSGKPDQPLTSRPSPTHAILPSARPCS